MKKHVIILLTAALLFGLTACGNKKSNDTSETNPPLDSSTKISSQSEAADESGSDNSPSSSQSKEQPPEYLDESQYSGDKLEIVQLINAFVKYRYDEDKEKYLSLLDKESNIYPADQTAFQLPAFKVQRAELQTEITITEQKSMYVSQVNVNEYRYDQKDPFTATLVFHKDKKPDGKWKIFLYD